jgi:hypothetical protein
MASKDLKLPASINTKEDPEKLFQLQEIIGTGSYGDVYKVYEFSYYYVGAFNC